MSTVDRYVPRALSPQRSRPVDRALARLDDQTTVAAARIQAEAELQSARVEAVAQVAGRAMQSVALLSQLEQSLAQTVPLAASRLQGFGEIASLAMLEVVSDTSARVRRCS